MERFTNIEVSFHGHNDNTVDTSCESNLNQIRFNYQTSTMTKISPELKELQWDVSMA